MLDPQRRELTNSKKLCSFKSSHCLFLIIVGVSEEPDEVKSLLEEGFEYVCQKDDLVYLGKRK